MIALDRPASARFFFNLASGTEVIRDETGVNLSLEGDVVDHIARALEDLYCDGSLASPAWKGWRMEVADCAGQTVLSFTLGGPIQDDGNVCPVPTDIKSPASA